jgi:NADH:ubiquinone oxidoreductase subunit 5 (subunit L)/multisubunit Na+/H+ antiporter MnhA subunit
MFYRGAGETDPLAQSQPALFRFLENKMWLDELYANTIIAGSRMLSRLVDWMDRYVWDGLVRLTGALGQLIGILSTRVDERGINPGADGGAIATRLLGRFIAARHSGQVQTYMGAVAVGALALLILYAWLA